MPKVFISHSTSDKGFVRKLVADLEAQGVSVWLDEKDIRVGDSIRTAIEQALAVCDFGVVVLSKTSIGRPWVQLELDALFALETSERRRIILPALIDNMPVPLLLRGKKYANFAKSYKSAFEELMGAIDPTSGTWDLKTMTMKTIIDHRRKDGSLSVVTKHHKFTALRDNLQTSTEDWTSDGDVHFSSVSPCTLKRFWKEGPTYFLTRTHLKKGSVNFQ